MSTPKKDKEPGELTEKELLVLGMAHSCFKGNPEIDWDKLAQMGSYQNPRSVQNLLNAAKKKIAIKASALGIEPTTPAKAIPRGGKGKAGTGSALKRKATAAPDAADEDAEGDDANPTPTPSKRARKTAVPKSDVKSAQGIDGEDAEEAGEDENGAATIEV
ncbi:Uu.00g107620.m01.CDS01 [Anthostomella pinea]|uniref:Uu.00g107620.m01.CDS01 n=1 Tax=Anthostomella pinea TaxID=933095 RepID=A0AAI8VFC1_9PEZI|nr:Uu.00g107620.m01.CDS01 [Anthostomella pinea]